MALTDDLEILGHVIVHVTLNISATKHAGATNLVSFLMLYGSGNLL